MNTEITEYNVSNGTPIRSWLPLMFAVPLVLTLRNLVPGWLFMWLMAIAIFVGCKWVTWSRAAKRPGVRQSPAAFQTALAYFVAWPGMDAPAFFRCSAAFQSDVSQNCILPGGSNSQRAARLLTPADCKSAIWQIENLRYVTAALLKTIAGIALLWLAVRGALGVWPLARGWLGMIGLVLFLHFGVFDLLALAWRRIGITAQPVMRAPLWAASLAEFWGKRWNTAFSTLAHQFVFRPVARRYGTIKATLAVFLISGLLHEAVISLPARGGYGLPTTYFALQGMGILLERSALGRRLGLGHGFRGWLFTVLLAGLPAYWLFHPIFVRNVILPMLDFIGAK